MDLQIFSRGQKKEPFWYQKGDKIIPATMGLVPSDLTSLGQRNSGLVAVLGFLSGGVSGRWPVSERAVKFGSGTQLYNLPGLKFPPEAKNQNSQASPYPTPQKESNSQGYLLSCAFPNKRQHEVILYLHNVSGLPATPQVFCIYY